MLVTVLPSYASGSAGLTWLRRDVDVESCWRWCCRVMLAIVLLSHAGNGAATQSCTGCGKVA
jgi:hypothetical protein